MWFGIGQFGVIINGKLSYLKLGNVQELRLGLRRLCCGGSGCRGEVMVRVQAAIVRWWLGGSDWLFDTQSLMWSTDLGIYGFIVGGCGSVVVVFAWFVFDYGW